MILFLRVFGHAVSCAAFGLWCFWAYQHRADWACVVYCALALSTAASHIADKIEWRANKN